MDRMVTLSRLDKYFDLKLSVLFYGTLILATLPPVVCLWTVLLHLSDNIFNALFFPIIIVQIYSTFVLCLFLRRNPLPMYLYPRILSGQVVAVDNQILRTPQGQPIDAYLYGKYFDAWGALSVLGKLDLANSKLRQVFSNTWVLVTVMGLQTIGLAVLPETVNSSGPYTLLIVSFALMFSMIALMSNSLKVAPHVMLAGYLAILEFYWSLDQLAQTAKGGLAYLLLKSSALKKRREVIRGVRNYMELTIVKQSPSLQRVDLDGAFCDLALGLDIGSQSQRKAVYAFAEKAMQRAMRGTGDDLKKCLNELLAADNRLRKLHRVRDLIRPSLGKPREDINFGLSLLRFASSYILSIATGLTISLILRAL